MSKNRIALAAVRFGDVDRIDDLLETVARSVQARGCSVVGFLQRETPDGPGCCPVTYLESIATGEQVRISQALGAGSRGCRLDPRALAGTTGHLLADLDARPQLLVLNRFGKGESDGHGFRSVIERACSLGVPVLTAVRATYEPAWNAFTGELGTFLVPEITHVRQWTLDAIAHHQRVLQLA